jgi:glyoxylase I family protein
VIRGINHVAVHTQNLERLLAFYRDVMGFTLASDVARLENSEVIDNIIGLKNVAARHVMLKAGNCFLELWEYSHPASREAAPLRPCDRGYTHLCLDVSDIESEYERLSRAGMCFSNTRIGTVGVLKALYGKDPDGNVIELQEAPEGHEFSLGQLGVVHLNS